MRDLKKKKKTKKQQQAEPRIKFRFGVTKTKNCELSAKKKVIMQKWHDKYTLFKIYITIRNYGKSLTVARGF